MHGRNLHPDAISDFADEPPLGLPFDGCEKLASADLSHGFFGAFCEGGRCVFLGRISECSTPFVARLVDCLCSALLSTW